MNITSYSSLLIAARSQPEPQRLLFTFARAELPADAGAAQKKSFAEKQGGTLLPVMCVDKSADELTTFADLAAESRQMGQDWDIVFVTTMSGRNGRQPTPGEVDAPLKQMAAFIEIGKIENFLAFNRDGELVQFF